MYYCSIELHCLSHCLFFPFPTSHLSFVSLGRVSKERRRKGCWCPDGSEGKGRLCLRSAPERFRSFYAAWFCWDCWFMNFKRKGTSERYVWCTSDAMRCKLSGLTQHKESLFSLSGGRDKRGGPILTFPARSNHDRIKQEDLRRLVTYLSTVPRCSQHRPDLSLPCAWAPCVNHTVETVWITKCSNGRVWNQKNE